MEIAGLTLGLTSLSLQQLKKIAKNDVIPPPRRKFPWRKLRGDGSNAIAAPGQKCPRRKPRDGDISRSMKKLEVDEESSAAESDGSLDNGNSEDNDSDNEDPLKDVLWPVSPVEIYMFYTKFEFLVKDNSECGGIPLLSYTEKELQRTFGGALAESIGLEPSSTRKGIFPFSELQRMVMEALPMSSESEASRIKEGHLFSLAEKELHRIFMEALAVDENLEAISVLECIHQFKSIEKEVRRVLMEALAENFNEPDERYIRNSAGVSDCTHGPECFCYFVSSTDAGIDEIGPGSNDVLKRVQQVLITAIRVSTSLLQYPLSKDTRKMLKIILSDDPFDLEAGLNFGEGEGTRSQWLGWESEFRNIGKPRKINLQPDARYPHLPTIDTPLRLGTAFLLRLIELLGRRVLVIGAVLKGIGAQFIKKEPLIYLHLGGLLGGHAPPTKQLAAATEAPSYPIRVINVQTLRFEEDRSLFRGSYAVLSHSWGQLEVTFATVNEVFNEMRQTRLKNITKQLNDQQKSDSRDGDKILALQEYRKQIEEELADNVQRGLSPQPKVNNAKLKGQRKLMGAIRKTKEAGFDYLWADSCCINKADNTELVESLSCMGGWYQNAAVCLVYLSDFRQGEVPSKLRLEQRPRWSTRGWTLQEIVMSSRAIYYNKFWKEIADTESLDRSTENANYSDKEDREKDDDSEADWQENVEDHDNNAKAKGEWGFSGDEGNLSKDKTEELEENKPWNALAYLSNVRPSSLLCCGKKPDVPASLILRLASQRETGRPEDQAYSLMGMLGVRIRADYGEGRARAMLRLLEGVIRTTRDVSIFNWKGRHNGATGTGCSMFPDDYRAFRYTRDLKPAICTSPISVSHVGVHGRFDICAIDKFVVEGSNSKAFEKLNEYAEKRSVNLETDSTRCFFEFSILFPVKVDMKIFCELKSLFTLLKDRETTSAPARTKWVLARFAGVQESNWFLCEIQVDSYHSSHEMYVDLLNATTEGNLAMRHSRARYLQYLETSGYRGKRLPSSSVKIDTSTEFQRVMMWVE